MAPPPVRTGATRLGAPLLLAALAGCTEDELTWVQVNDPGDCLSMRITSAGDCAEAEATASIEVTCCDGAAIGSATMTPGCGALGDEFSLTVELVAEDDQIDLSEVARVSLTVPNEGTELTELELRQSDLQENLWELTLGAGEMGGTDRTDELCVAVWEVESGGDGEDGEE